MRIWSLVEEEETSLFSRQNGSGWAREERRAQREVENDADWGKDRVTDSPFKLDISSRGRE